MRQAFGLRQIMVILAGLALVATVGLSEPVAPEKLPEPVAKTFWAAFPTGTIAKLDVETEEGVVVYDFEFTAGGREKEADIAGDGTMIESTLVITAKDVPPAAMKGIKAAAKGAKLGRTEWIETFYGMKEGQLIKLPKSEIHYAVELSRRNQKAEVFVDPTGKVTEAPEWVDATPAKAAPAGGSPK